MATTGPGPAAGRPRAGWATAGSATAGWAAVGSATAGGWPAAALLRARAGRDSSAVPPAPAGPGRPGRLPALGSSWSDGRPRLVRPRRTPAGTVPAGAAPGITWGA